MKFKKFKGSATIGYNPLLIENFEKSIGKYKYLQTSNRIMLLTKRAWQKNWNHTYLSIFRKGWSTNTLKSSIVMVCLPNYKDFLREIKSVWDSKSRFTVGGIILSPKPFKGALSLIVEFSHVILAAQYSSMMMSIGHWECNQGSRYGRG